LKKQDFEQGRKKYLDLSVTKSSSPNNLVESTNSKCVQCFFIVGISIHNMVAHDLMIETFYVYVDNAAQYRNAASNWLVKRLQ